MRANSRKFFFIFFVELKHEARKKAIKLFAGALMSLEYLMQNKWIRNEWLKVDKSEKIRNFVIASKFTTTMNGNEKKAAQKKGSEQAESLITEKYKST